MRKRFEELKKDQKGFTLVELIVVLVILAIMAALLAPALLGYIDKARTSKYLEECRSIYTAIQAIDDERYAKSGDPVDLSVQADRDKINDLVYPTKVTAGTVSHKTGGAAGTKEQARNPYIIDKVDTVTFTSQDGSVITATQDTSGEWTVQPPVKNTTTTNS
ncbi:MAG: prepilin-type N-terminal cleavage/methylation domain-containing protein [Lachnospiraceae bacterium]|nr:prepilin-type N-terminal cleavage/methylation domain-containing protein [Lachnospiraceae bacterium]